LTGERKAPIKRRLAINILTAIIYIRV
jgi:hypothetical protein